MDRNPNRINDFARKLESWDHERASLHRLNVTVLVASAVLLVAGVVQTVALVL